MTDDRLLRFTFAVSSYDHVQPVVDGRIPIEGAAPLFVRLPIPEMFRRFVNTQDWEASEVSFVKYVTMRAAGDDRVTAIPVFPSRMYRQTAIYVDSRRVREPADLTGARIGIPEWANSAGVWARGLLADMHGIDPADITWYQGGIDRPGRAVVMAAPFLPDNVRIVPVADRSLEEMLWAGDLEAIIVPTPPASIASSVSAGGVIRYLYDDPVAAERAYWEKTRCLPIMHVIAVSRRLVERAPDITDRIYRAMDSARREYFLRLADDAVSRAPLPWIGEHLASLQADGTPWPYGIEPNIATIECLLRYARAQGLVNPGQDSPELFPDWAPAAG
jgi:4,5-dihydroxyphthalate decarboxylase